MGWHYWWKTLLILEALLKIFPVHCGIPQVFQPKAGNPPELNNFLTSVLNHENDFRFVKHIAEQYQKLKRDKYSIDANEDVVNASLEKRYAHTNHNLKKKQYKRGKGLNPRKRRHLENLMKKDVMDLTSSVHQTAKAHKHSINDMSNHNKDLYYVDLGESAKQHEDDKDDVKRGPEQILKQFPHQNYEQIELNSNYNNMGAVPERINDDAGFEKALTYNVESDNRLNEDAAKKFNLMQLQHSNDLNEMQFKNNLESKNVGNELQYNKNVMGNDLNEMQFQNNLESKNVANELQYNKNLMGMNQNVKSSAISNTELIKPQKLTKHIGNGFAEIAKNGWQDEDNLQEMNKETNSNFFNPFKTKSRNEHQYQKRKLQFIDDSMMDFEDDVNDDIVSRPRRDFLDALGIKNEDDYSEDVPNKSDLYVNNTDVHNDTHFRTTTEKCGGTKSSTIKNSKSTPTTTEANPVIDIKQILEEPKELNDQTVGNFNRSLNQNKRTKKNGKIRDSKHRPKKEIDYKKQPRKARLDSVQDFDDVIEENTRNDFRRSRNVDDFEAQIMKNKCKLQNSPSCNMTTRRKRTRKERWNLPVEYNRNKKEDIDKLIADINENQTSSVVLSEGTTSTTESDVNNSTYEQVANQIDVENEKLSHVVSGHLATKIVSNVFEELGKMSKSNKKIMSGLTRKNSLNHGINIEVDFFKANETEDVDEARLLLQQITKSLNKLVLNQVQRKLCNRLSNDLKQYLNEITNVRNSEPVSNFEPNSDQGSFLFAYQAESSLPSFNVYKLQQTLSSLEQLLLSYQKMNPECQEKAQPVRDYIVNHIQTLKTIMTCPSRSLGKRSDSKEEEDANLIEKQLNSVGMGSKNAGFIPNFDIDAIVKSKLRNNVKKNLNMKRDARASRTDEPSEKFRKLQMAVEKMRQKRKIGEVFGGSALGNKKKRSVDFEQPIVYNIGT